MDNLESLKSEITDQVAAASDLDALEQARIAALGDFHHDRRAQRHQYMRRENGDKIDQPRREEGFIEGGHLLGTLGSNSRR